MPTYKTMNSSINAALAKALNIPEGHEKKETKTARENDFISKFMAYLSEQDDNPPPAPPSSWAETISKTHSPKNIMISIQW